MFICSMIASEYDDDPDKPLPQDIKCSARDVYPNGEEAEFLDYIVRFHAGDSEMYRSLEGIYFNKECPGFLSWFLAVP